MATDLSHLPPQHDVIIATPRLHLRPVEPTDLSVMHEMRRDPAVMRYMPGVETEPVAEKSRSVDRLRLMMAAGMFSFAVEVLPMSDGTRDTPSEEEKARERGGVIGFVGVTSPPQVFYIFARASWGMGYATEALRAFIGEYWARFPEGLAPLSGRGSKSSGGGGGRTEYGMGGGEVVLEAHVHEGNVGSEKVLERCGFEIVGGGVAEAHGREVSTRIFRLSRL